jgi:hypothetical protein
METSMPTKNASPSVKLAVFRREVGMGVSQAKDGRMSKRSISGIVPGDIRRPAGVLGVTYIAPDFDEPSTSITDLFEGRD